MEKFRIFLSPVKGGRGLACEIFTPVLSIMLEDYLMLPLGHYLASRAGPVQGLQPLVHPSQHLFKPFCQVIKAFSGKYLYSNFHCTNWWCKSELRLTVNMISHCMLFITCTNKMLKILFWKILYFFFHLRNWKWKLALISLTIWYLSNRRYVIYCL